jgi:hypothetical protein
MGEIDEESVELISQHSRWSGWWETTVIIGQRYWKIASSITKDA